MKHLKKLTALTLATLLAFTCYVGYQEVSADITADGHFDVTNTTSGASSTDGWSYSSNTITISQTGDYTISKACNCTEGSVHHSYSIVIEGNLTVNLTIEDVMIENTSGAAMDIDGSSTVTLTFVGDNSFASASQYAGIQFNDATGSLEIASYTNGSLTAQGGTAGAGIGGGGQYGSSSNITISGGTITAIGGYGAAGIGGGYYASASNITITGGTVTAIRGTGGAGIGGGWDASASNITISGGSVKTSRISTTPQNEDDEYVYLATIADATGVNIVTVDGTNYNISDNHPDDDNLYLYLTGEDHEVIVNTSIYSATWNELSLSFTVTRVGEVETSTEGTTDSSSSGTIIVDTSTK